MHSAALYLQMAPMKMSSKRSSGTVRKVVKSILDARVEHKQATFDFSAASLAAGVINDLTEAIIQGDAVNQRSGNQIIVTSIDFTLTSLAATNAISTLRCILFIDRINLGSRPVVTDVLTAASPASSYQVQGRVQNRYKILSDFHLLTAQSLDNNATPLVVINSHSNGTPANAVKHVKLRLKDKVFYNAATAIAGANGKGAIHILFVDIANSACTYTLGMNLSYTDS